MDDTTRRVRGVVDPLAVEERLANLLSDRIAPHLLPDIDILPWRHTAVVAVQVFPSPNRPHYLKTAGLSSGVYVRVGSTNRRADADLIAELQRTGLDKSFNEQPLPALNSEALDFRAASECFAPVRKLKRSDLETLRLLVPYQGRKVPTVAGVLLFGQAREAHFPDAWIQAGRFTGADKTHLGDSVALHGPLPTLAEQAIEFIAQHGLRGFKIGAVRRTEHWAVPPVALREAIINAIVHADYSQRGAPLRIAVFSDRVEIENPGMLLSSLTIEDLHRGISKLRNRIIGRVFQELGLIEQWGSGIARMSAACRDAGLPAPRLEELGTRFRVTLYTEAHRASRASRVAPHAAPLDAIDQAIVDALANSAGLSTREIAAHIARTPRTARTRLTRLVARGLVREIGSSPQDPQGRYVTAKTK